MRSFGFVLLACATVCFILIFGFWGANIWTEDARYGSTAALFIIPTVIFTVVGGMLVDA